MYVNSIRKKVDSLKASIYVKLSNSKISISECGAGFTSKLEGMFKDMELSKDIMSSYKQVSFLRR